MDIPLLDLKAQYRTIKKEIDAALKRVVREQHFILSKEVELLEGRIAEYIGVKFATGVASGTDALTLSMIASGIGKGDEVITTPFTFIATSEAISQAGAKPVFVDIDPRTYNIDVLKVEKLLQSTIHDPRSTIKAIIPVHIYGQPADIEAIMEIAKKYKLKVIEDCAQALGSEYEGRKCGSFGTCSCISFFPSKNLGGFGDGGMVVTNDENIAKKIRMLRVHGSKKQYIHEFIGYNSRLDSLQAAILRVKLKYLDKWITKKRENAAYYNSRFGKIGITTPQELPGQRHSYHQYTIRLKERDRLSEWLTKKGIGNRVYYPLPLHLQPCYRELGYKEGDFPFTEEAAAEVLSIPVYPELTKEELKFVADMVLEFTQEKKLRPRHKYGINNTTYL